MTTWLITGCSTGLGRALAEAVLARGDSAVVTARDVATVAPLVAAHPDTALAVPLDVTDPAQVTAAVAAGEERFGGIDVLVNNAGYGYRAAIEEGDDADVQRLFATNVWGPVALIKAVLPGMRARRSGTVVNLSSIAASLCPMGSGYYAAAKAAVEGISLSLAQEVAPLGIRVVVVEPGGFRTDFGGRSIAQSATVIDDYAATAGTRRPRAGENQSLQTAGDPALAAQALITLATADEVPTFFAMGSDALAVVRDAIARRAAALDAYEQLSASTDNPV